jgi:hypothetical protein
MRRIGWVIVALVLVAMAFARLTDDKERSGRKPRVAPVTHEASGSHAAPAQGGHRAAVSESL